MHQDYTGSIAYPCDIFRHKQLSYRLRFFLSPVFAPPLYNQIPRRAAPLFKERLTRLDSDRLKTARTFLPKEAKRREAEPSESNCH